VQINYNAAIICNFFSLGKIVQNYIFQKIGFKKSGVFFLCSHNFFSLVNFTGGIFGNIRYKTMRKLFVTLRLFRDFFVKNTKKHNENKFFFCFCKSFLAQK